MEPTNQGEAPKLLHAKSRAECHKSVMVFGSEECITNQNQATHITGVLYL
jgi:hypothetical protein